MFVQPARQRLARPAGHVGADRREVQVADGDHHAARRDIHVEQVGDLMSRRGHLAMMPQEGAVSAQSPVRLAGSQARSAEKNLSSRAGERIPSLRMELGEYDHRAVEAAVRELWEAHDIYRYDRGGDGPVFSVDTPPPYVSAAHLHVGHAMCYTQAEFVVRYHRMRGGGCSIRWASTTTGCRPSATWSRSAGSPVDMPRTAFPALCLEETSRVADLRGPVAALGLSVDWSLRYSTIDARCQRTAQTSSSRCTGGPPAAGRGPDPVVPGGPHLAGPGGRGGPGTDHRLHTIRFGDADLLIATTRPELLPACVALYHHPDDPRYAGLSGRPCRCSATRCRS